MDITDVVSLDDSRLQAYRTLRRPLEHQLQGIFVAEGEKVVRRLFESNLTIVSALLTPEWFEVYRKLLESKGDALHVYIAAKQLVESIVGFHLHQGIMAVAQIPEPTPIETIITQSPRPHLFVSIDGLTNAENVGVLVRNCAAFGVQALFVGDTASSPYLRRAVRSSMGTVFRMPVVHVVGLADALNTMRSEYTIRNIAAHPHATATALNRVKLTENCCIVFGSEGGGISNAVLAACDESVAIPMKNAVDSLNVGSASAAILYEAMRQRSVESDP